MTATFPYKRGHSSDHPSLGAKAKMNDALGLSYVHWQHCFSWEKVETEEEAKEGGRKGDKKGRQIL